MGVGVGVWGCVALHWLLQRTRSAAVPTPGLPPCPLPPRSPCCRPTPHTCSYQIRSIPTISGDRIYCKVLAHNAVHAAFAGFTGTVVGLVNTHYVYLPVGKPRQGGGVGSPAGLAWGGAQLVQGAGRWGGGAGALSGDQTRFPCNCLPCHRSQWSSRRHALWTRAASLTTA